MSCITFEEFVRVGDGDGDGVSVLGALDLGLMMPSSLSISSCKAIQVQKVEGRNKVRRMNITNDTLLVCRIKCVPVVWFQVIYQLKYFHIQTHKHTLTHTHHYDSIWALKEKTLITYFWHIAHVLRSIDIGGSFFNEKDLCGDEPCCVQTRSRAVRDTWQDYNTFC